MIRDRFLFATVTSQGYVDQTAGLWLNLREVYPEASLIVCALDEAGYAPFAALGAESGIICVRAERLWGEAYWRNICARMTRPERAFATKAALPQWALEQGASAVIVLDSDLLFLQPVDDLIEEIRRHDILLVAARHHLRNWQKSDQFGIFSAGIVGFNSTALSAARIWRSQTFEECRALPIAGVFNEQKYLDYFLGFFDVAIIRDPGINVSPTIINLVRPQYRDGAWITQTGTPIKIYHHSRSASAANPFARMKRDYNLRGLSIVAPESREATASERAGTPRKRFSFGQMIKALRIGGFLEALVSRQAVLSRFVFDLYRVLVIDDLNLRERWRETFSRKRALQDELQRTAFVDFESRINNRD